MALFKFYSDFVCLRSYSMPKNGGGSGVGAVQAGFVVVHQHVVSLQPKICPRLLLRRPSFFTGSVIFPLQKEAALQLVHNGTSSARRSSRASTRRTGQTHGRPARPGGPPGRGASRGWAPPCSERIPMDRTGWPANDSLAGQ
jgi:hypothetical protein